MTRILVDHDYCKGCGLCVALCPAGVLVVSDERNQKGYLMPRAENPEECTGCLNCEVICPDLAILVEKGRHETGS